MSDAMIYAIVTALPPTVAALCAFVMDLKNHRKLDEHKQALGEVHTMVNANLLAAQAELRVATRRIIELQEIVRLLREQVQGIKGPGP
jgi:hypothetical protein